MYLEKILALLAAALVAVGAGIGLTWLALNPTPRMADAGSGIAAPANAPADKGSARQQIETLIASTPDYARYFARLRETFTADIPSTTRATMGPEVMNDTRSSKNPLPTCSS